MDCAVERTRVSECLMREMMSLEVVPNAFDVVQFGRIFGQPLDDEPMGAGGQCRQRELARVDRSIVLDQQHRLDGLSGLRAIQPVDLLEMGDEVAAALGRAGVQDELACDVIERSNEPSMATFFACPGAGTRRSAPALAQARARYGCVSASLSSP